MTSRPAAGAASGTTVIASLTNGSPWTRAVPNKVPGVSSAFWVLTILSAVAGATAADFLSGTLGSGLGMSATTAIVGLVVVASTVYQLSTGRCVPGSYWLAVVLMSVLGTLVSDDLAFTLGFGVWATTGVFGAALAVSFTGWLLREHTLSPYAVSTRRREAWYWFALLCAFSLGTSLGDLFSEELALGLTTTGLVLGGVMGALAFAHHNLRLNAVVAVWTAYVLVRPLGETLGDFLTTTRGGGLGLGANGTSTVLLLAMLVLVGLLTRLTGRSADPRSGAGQVSRPTVRP